MTQTEILQLLRQSEQQGQRLTPYQCGQAADLIETLLVQVDGFREWDENELHINFLVSHDGQGSVTMAEKDYNQLQTDIGAMLDKIATLMPDATAWREQEAKSKAGWEEMQRRKDECLSQ